MRKINTFGLSLAALAASGWIATASAQPAAGTDTTTPAAPSADTSTPAAAPAPAKHHHMHSMKSGSTHASKEAGDSAVEDLNAQSLDAAKAGKPFTPSATPAPAAKPAAKPTKPTHMHHHMAKKPAPAPDASTPK